MTRSDIQVITRRMSITILSKDNQMTFAPSGKAIAMFTTSLFTEAMVGELEKAKIVEVESCTYIGECGTVKINKRFGFTNEKFTELLIYIIEKYNL